MNAVRTYVKVNSDFDCTGYMHPRVITWQDGRTFRIDAVRDLFPAKGSDRYTVVIRGKERYLYYEHPSELRPCPYGRWFVLAESS